MSFSQSHTRTIEIGGDISISEKRTTSSGGQANVDEVVADGASNLAIAWAMVLAKLKAIAIQVTGGDLTLETNDAGTPDDTLVLEDGKIYDWVQDDQGALFLTADVTGLFATNASGADVRLRIFAVYDPT